MSIGLGVTRVFEMDTEDASVDLNSTGDKITWTPFKPVNVYRVGVIIDSATASGTDLVVALDHRVTAGSDTDRVELFTVSPDVTREQGEGFFGGEEVRNEINPGEQLVFEVTTAAGVAATGRVFVEAVEYPFQRTSSDPTEDRLTNMTEGV